MTNVWCVRADFGKYTAQFLEGGYCGIGFMQGELSLAGVTNREELRALYQSENPADSPFVVGQQVGQMARFLLEMKAGDYVLTPAADTEWLQFGVVAADPSYKFVIGEDDLSEAGHIKEPGCVDTPVARSTHSLRLFEPEGREKMSDQNLEFLRVQTEYAL
jgi:predicted Mrr-cat superfamily restriction endonuclease